MNFSKIRSYAKLNLSLNVIKKIPKKNHLIESIITFINLHDLIFIRQAQLRKHKIEFIGKFSKKISKKNSIQKLLNLLDQKNYFKIKNLKLK